MFPGSKLSKPCRLNNNSDVLVRSGLVRLLKCSGFELPSVWSGCWNFLSAPVRLLASLAQLGQPINFPKFLSWKNKRHWLQISLTWRSYGEPTRREALDYQGVTVTRPCRDQHP